MWRMTIFTLFFSLSWLQMLNLPALLQNKNTRIGPFPWKWSVLQNPDRERTNQSTGICLGLGLPYNNISYPPEQCQCVRNARVGVRAWEHEIASKWVRFTLNAWDLRALNNNNNNNSIIGLSSAFPIEDTPQLTNGVNTYLGITNSWNPLAATAEGISAEEKIQHKNCLGGRVGVVVRALAFHQSGPGLISAQKKKMWIEFVGSLLCY